MLLACRAAGQQAHQGHCPFPSLAAPRPALYTPTCIHLHLHLHQPLQALLLLLPHSSPHLAPTRLTPIRLVGRRDVRTREVGIQEIHSREGGNDNASAASVRPDEVELLRRDYCANGGGETFLSFEDPRQDILVGLLRLRKLAGGGEGVGATFGLQFAGEPLHEGGGFRVCGQANSEPSLRLGMPLEICAALPMAGSCIRANLPIPICSNQ